MTRYKWQILLGLLLIAVSAGLYLLHYAIFGDVHHIFVYMLGDIAFVPIEVLLVTLIIHQLLTHRERRNRLEKLNMVIGVFFSEMGTELLTLFSDFDPKLDEIRNDLIVRGDWSEQDFAKISNGLRNYDYAVDIQRIDLGQLDTFLAERREFLVRLLENPTLLEHESFTDLLQAVFHVSEELSSREDLEGLPESDLQHLTDDIKRAYGLLVHFWLDYMSHLSDNYPYLFSLAMRTNPFDQEASPVVR
jgi:hypothetical protein